MTKEALEKDYYADRPTEPYSADDCANDWANIAHYAEENLEKAFERIAELEELLINSKNLSDTIEKAQKKQIADLEKKVGRYQTGMFDEIEKRDKKLTKAKEIIKELVRVEYADFTNGDYSNELSKVLEKAEQFLKDSEVEK